MEESSGDILQPGEIETYIKCMESSKIEELGSPLWFESHHRLQKLNQQAIIEAAQMREESVKDFLISYNKVPVLIHEAVCIQVWREKIFRQILKQKREPKHTFIGYIILYHEITVVTLLQNIFYHKDSILGLDDAVLDLIDYCAAEIVRLLSRNYQNLETLKKDVTNLEELENQSKAMGFNIGLASICILRYLIEYLDELALSATSRLYTTHDIPLLLTNLIQLTPWKRTNHKTNIVQIYNEGSWKNIEKVAGIPKYEGQCWIALQYLLLDSKCPTYYEMTDFRKQHFVKVQKHLTENVIDQISPLMHLKQFLARLSISGPAKEQRKPLIVETVPEIKTQILNEGFKKWKTIAAKHIAIIFDGEKEFTLEIAKRLGETYNLDDLERVIPESPICSNCGDPASKRCSKCKTEWYCGRECQVKRWPKHKTVCNLMSEKNDQGDH